MEISEEIEYELTTSDDTTYVFSFEEVKTYTNPLDSQIIGIKIQTPFFVRTETSETLADGKVVSHVEHKECSDPKKLDTKSAWLILTPVQAG